MTTLTKSTGTVTLSGAVEKVTLPAAYGWVWVKNMSDADMFAGLSADISEGADGVMVIPAGECGRIQTDGFNSIYLMGTGNALVVAQNYADCPFKVGGKGGESPDLSEYAKKTDIPTELPANGGNADTVNGHTVNADVPENAVFTDTIPDLSPYALKALYGDNGLNLGRLADSAVGFLSSTIGRANAATGGYSFSQGFDNTASGVASFAGGQSSVADGENALSHGYYVKTTKDNEKAFGVYNKSSTDTIFSVGDGTADDARHNAFEITTTGGKLHDKEISTTPIKSTNVSGTTNESGDIYLWGVDTGNIPISACGSPDTVFSPFLNGDASIYMLHAISVYTDSPVANTAVTATVYYF